MIERLLPRGLSFFHPVCLLGTWFGSGLLPHLPGTWGSLAALPFGWLILTYLGRVELVIAAFVLFFVGWWVSSIFVSRTRYADPPQVVVDEVAAQWLVLVAAPLSPLYFALAFVLFRFFDIMKVWPASWADRRVEGGFGVMLDDVLAAPYAMGILYLVASIFGHAP